MTNYDPEQWEDFRETFASKRPLTNEEWARVGQGDNTVFQDVNWRHPTIHEAPPQPSKVGKWTRGFPGRPRDFPEWSRQAVLPRSVGDLPTTYLYWIDGDAETIIRDAHQSLIAQYQEALAGPVSDTCTMARPLAMLVDPYPGARNSHRPTLSREAPDLPC